MKYSYLNMKLYFSLLFVLFFSLFSYSQDNAELVKLYIEARNDHNFENISAVLDINYQEHFIDGTVEIDSLIHLKKHLEWGEIMDSQCTLHNLEAIENKVVTTESFSNYMDLALGKEPRMFKMTYLIKDNRILNSIIDTLPGYSKIMKDAAYKNSLFKEHCEKHDLPFSHEMDVEGAKKLRVVLSHYLENREE